jgi:tetratricopeptide (TPR) repeat protein
MSSEKPQPRDVGAQREADVYDLLAWLEVNKKKAAVVAVVLVVIGFAIATMRYMRQQKEENASGALLALKPTLTPQTNVPPPQASALLKVADEYSGTTAAERARILAATALFTEGRYADAEKEFSRFVKDFPESPWVAEAAYGVAASQEAQNKVTDAQASYQNVATAYANSSVADDAKLAQARIYEEQKKPDQALRLYNDLLAPRPGAQPGEMGNPAAFQKKEALLRLHPELNTNLTTRPLPAPALEPAGTNTPAGTNPPATSTNTAVGATTVTNPAAQNTNSSSAPAAK